MLLSDVQVDERLVLQLAPLVEPELATKLVTAFRLRLGVVTLTPREREAILAALADALPPSLREVREALLASDAWHPRQTSSGTDHKIMRP